MVWEKTKDVMQEFVLYMDTAEITSYAANCDNAAWDHHKNPTAGSIYFGQTVGDKIICVLMAGALFFMNGWTITQSTRSTEDEISERIREHLRCAIVHMFSAVLDESVCPGMRGTFYAWKTMERMDTGDGGFPEGLIKRGICGRELSSNLQIRQLDLNTKVKQWLRQDSRLKGVIQKIKGNALCTKRWQDAWNLEDILGNGNTQDTQALQIAPIVDELKKGINDLLTELGKKVDQDVKNRQQAKKGNIAKDDQNGDADTTATVPAATTGSTALEATNPKPPPTSQPSENTPVTPPPPPPPSPPQQDGSATAGDGPKVQPNGTHIDKAGKCGSKPTVSVTQNAGSGIYASSSETLVSFGTSAGTDDECGTKPEDPQEGKEKSDGSSTPTELDPKSSVAAEPAAEVPTKPEVSKVTPGSEGATGVTSTEVSAQPQGKAGPEGGEGTPAASAPKTGSSDDTITPPKDSTSNDKTQGCEHPASAAGPDPGVAVIDGGNDDPPPLNPPKPKPNPNPDQAGSSGGEGKGGGDVGGTQLVTPSVRPGVTWEDIKSYTPEIIPAVVGIGIIAFFLWKYFAYLAQRRRKFRTVRDVPSPGLDEEILHHLQRGAPPPDYGYTMVRDRRPASAADRRRRRNPRVHKRTIIELHLQVLNECAATAWENVKDDYWQIVVQQFAQDFAQDLMRADDTYNNIFGVSTSDYGSPGTNVSSALDPSTDIERTDECALNDPDPWSCMETIQLATDPCPPHDSDPWSCMETIQLQTHPCRPTEDNPDPWRCVENIQLATDRAAPNEEDRWNCMETIQLEQERPHSPPLPSSVPGNENRAPDHTNWIPWIDRNKHLLQACTTQPWFHALKAEWKQYYQQHAQNAASSEHRKAATMERKKLDAWKEWVAKQHDLMNTYSEEEWFQRLLHNVEADTVRGKGEVPGVGKDLHVETLLGTEDILRVRDVPRTQPMHPQPYMKQPLTAKTWILILAFILAECEVECRLQHTELYVDELLDQL
ncbi:hypothetical protein AK88_03346 [Plasmodium fragile]|uniref:Schizont-infected cell agglutination C-terminal domain-containing protein n=1 Tax=Plasmodium fragile TaxID=5857 RepID=A0A0D9QJ20_PLAFR|nr:uncharacterized protein AK88_03346 [Plasmodium fragile]KJP87060.1 hypothetical protein AK88_03346 [Plasmodium fragile]